MKITSTGQSIWNPITGGFGIAVGGQQGSGSVEQYNNGKADTRNVGSASKNGSIHSVLCTDSQDTVQLGRGWTKQEGDVVDDATGIHGTLYTSASGDQLLISGGAKVAPPPDDPTRKKSLSTLTTGTLYADADTDHKDGLSMAEAQAALAKAPEGDAKEALKWLTTSGHFEEMGGSATKGVTFETLKAESDYANKVL